MKWVSEGMLRMSEWRKEFKIACVAIRNEREPK